MLPFGSVSGNGTGVGIGAESGLMRLFRRQQGQSTIEYLLVVGAVGVVIMGILMVAFSVIAHYVLGVVLYSAGRTEDAVKAYKESIRLAPPDPLLLVLLALPVVFIGFWLGSRLATRMNETLFRRAAIGVIVASSISVLAREISTM